eukprot:gb/GECH01001932.1/.p1 GENE.gb/GECH01001932.1/~~gb/GECH01001932.1/.p1  ORF type:complete len:436 (+),score=169.67 gb/GECH01001932.1/:1-1308(+)
MPKQDDKRKIKKNGDEQQFALRVPEDVGEKIHELMREQKVDMDLEFQSKREGVLRVGDTSFKAKLVDLPCIVESYKSVDKHTYYKIGDVGQMVLVLPPDLDYKDIPDEMESGLSNPTYNIQKHWRKRQANVTEEDIEDMKEEFLKLMEEDDPNNVELEVFSESEDESEDENEDYQTTDMDYSYSRKTGSPSTAASTPLTAASTPVSTAGEETEDEVEIGDEESAPSSLPETTMVFGQEHRSTDERMKPPPSRTPPTQQPPKPTKTSPQAESPQFQIPSTLEGSATSSVSQPLSQSSATTTPESTSPLSAASPNLPPESSPKPTMSPGLQPTQSPQLSESLEGEFPEPEEQKEEQEKPKTPKEQNPKYQELMSQKKTVEQEVNSLTNTVESKRTHLAKIPNPMLRAKFEKEVSKLSSSLEEKKQKLQDIIQSMEEF